jgi:hypothetical protein
MSLGISFAVIILFFVGGINNEEKTLIDETNTLCISKLLVSIYTIVFFNSWFICGLCGIIILYGRSLHNNDEQIIYETVSLWFFIISLLNMVFVPFFFAPSIALMLLNIGLIISKYYNMEYGGVIFIMMALTVRGAAGHDSRSEARFGLRPNHDAEQT